MTSEPVSTGQVVWQTLIPHPQTPCRSVREAQAALVRQSPGDWLVRFCFNGPVAEMCIPQPSLPRRADELWRHFCGELFVLMPDGRYNEFNFSPSGCWAAYAFDSYRSGMQPLTLPRDPRVTCRSNAEQLELEVRLTVPAELADAASLRFALCAMVEEADGVLSCWAARHAGERPDFHHPAGFAPLAQ